MIGGTTPRDQENSSGSVNKHKRVSSGKVYFNETSYCKENTSPSRGTRGHMLNPERSENNTPEKFKSSLKRGDTSLASPYAKLDYFESIN